MSLFQALKDSIQSYLAPEQCLFIERAYKYAYAAHDGVKRASGEPYITHPVAVAEILAEMRLDHEAIAAALLHDVLEDTDTTHQEIAAAFNPSVAELVEGVTKLDKFNFDNREQAQAENIRKMLIAMSKDFRVMLIKLADRVHNMRTLDSLRLAKRRRIARETFEIFTPIADRLGLHHLKNELEKLAFKAQNASRYSILDEAIKKARGNRKDFIQRICDEISAKLDNMSIEAKVIGREKHLYSLYQKMRKKGCHFHDVMDVYAFRIIVKDLDTCYRVLGQMHHLYQPKLKYFKDYIALPKSNSYQSLHTTLVTHHGVNIEVQIRTEDMDAVAKHGIAAHWSYKEGKGNSNLTAQLQTRNWFQGLSDPDENTTNSLALLENIKQELGKNEIHVLTPQGKVIVLPAHATPVDFAYAVHSKVGHHCISAKVDNEFALLSDKLES
ncbi:MAG: RelA/SpoT family protein, partial [Psychromonas sp.]|nr:RelA/SpoT family protein [Psychromonas sp.]